MNESHGRQTGKQNTAYRNQFQIYGNVVPKDSVVRELEQPLRRQPGRTVKKREHRRSVTLPYVLFMMGAIMLIGVILIGYLRMQSRMTVQLESIASLESQLNDIRLTNDEQIQRINSAVSMDEIKRIAVEELGMTYAKEGQVLTISDEGSDYVRQIRSLPNE